MAVVWTLALTCCALWGSAFACIKTGYKLFRVAENDPASQILFAGCRFFLAGVLVTLIGSVMARAVLRPRRGEMHRVFVLSLFQTIGQYVCFYIALAHLSGVKGTIIDGAVPIFSVLVATLVVRQEKLTAAKAAGCLIGFAGLVLVTLDGSAMDLSFRWNGEGLMLFAALSTALSNVFIRRFSQYSDPVMLSGWQFMAGGLAMVGIGLALGGSLTLTTPWALLLLFYMAIISSVAYSVWSVLLKHNPVSRIVVFGFMTQVFGVLISAVVLNEFNRLNWSTLLSLVLVCSGIYLTTQERTGFKKEQKEIVSNGREK